MVFSDTTNKNGLLQSFEFWTRQPDGTVTGSATLLKQITARINAGFDKVMPFLLSYSDYIRWDDTNHTDRPSGTLNVVSGQNDYTLTEDDNALDILNLTAVRIKTSSSATEFTSLTRMTLDDSRAENAILPNPTITGTPTHFLENAGTLFLYPEPNFSATAGMQIFFEREQSYFVSTDTTKEPGIPKPFHELLALHAALDWNKVNRSKERGLINDLKEEITRQQNKLFDLISLKNPVRIRMSAVQEDNR